MKNPDHLSPRDLERLSGYLDGECSNKEAAKLEAWLRVDPVLRQALEELRATAGLLRALPEIPTPRSFALTPDMVGLKPRRPYPVLRLATALASIAFVALIGLDGLTTLLAPFGGSFAPAGDMRQVGVMEQEAVDEQMMAAESAAAPTEGNGVSDELEGFFESEPTATQWLQVTAQPDVQQAPPLAEGGDRSEDMTGQADADATPTLAPKSIDKYSGTSAPAEGMELPRAPEGDSVSEVEPTAQEPEPRLGVLDWPTWRIGLRAGEIAFGLTALVLASLMLWTRRK